MSEVLNIVLVEVLKLAIVGAFALIVPILVKVLQKAGIQLTAEKEARLNQVALLVAAEVEEWAASKLKANLPVSSGDKLDRAIEGLLMKIPGISAEEAEDAIRAALPQIGLGAAAGLKEIGKALGK